MAQNLRSVSVVFQAFTDKFEKSVDKAGGKITGFGKKVVGAFAGFIAAKATLSAFSNQMKEISQLGKISETLQVGPDFLRGLELASNEMGLSFERAKDLVQEFGVKIGEAMEDGTGTAANGLKILGIEIKQLEGLNVEEKFLKIAEAIKGIEDPQKRIFAAGEIFGGVGEDMLALLNQGEAGLKKFIATARELGGPISEGDIKRIQEANMALIKIEKLFSGMIGQLAIAFAPAIENIATSLKEVLSISGDISNFWKDIELGIGGALISLQEYFGALSAEEADQARVDLYDDIFKKRADNFFKAGGDDSGALTPFTGSIKSFSDAAAAQSSRAFDILNPNRAGSVQNKILMQNKRTADAVEKLADSGDVKLRKTDIEGS